MNSHIQSQSHWTREQEKQFERGIVMFVENDPHRWHKIANYVAGNKTESQVYQHYQDLVTDIKEIEEGRVEFPCYSDHDESSSPPPPPKTKQSGGGESERKKGIPWTEEEHRAFLYGLEKYGKGDWRSISRNAVHTRTPTQVASHAQKYFLRLNAENKERKRSSIHDITTTTSKCISDRPVQATMDNLTGSFPRQGDYFGCR